MKRKLLFGLAITVTAFSNAQTDCSDIFISEYVEGSDNNKAIELYNPTSAAIVLDGLYSMGRDRDGAGNPMLLAITGTIASHDVRVFALDKRDPNGTGLEIPLDGALEAVADTFLNPVYVQNNSPMYFNGDDAFVLVKNGTTILDIVGRIGEDPGSGWWVPGDPATAWWTVDNTMIRKPGVKYGVAENPAVFDPSLEWDSIPVNTFDSLGYHFCECGSINVDEFKPGSFSMFPNPMEHGQFAIRGSRDLFAYSLLSMDGKLIERKQIRNGQNFVSITLPQAAAGMYYIEIEFTDGTRSAQKLISK